MDARAVDGPVELGVRPEHLKIDPEGDVHITVEAVENLGVDTIVYGRTAAQEAEPIAIRVEGDRDFATNSTIRVKLDPAAVHLFDAGTGLRI